MASNVRSPAVAGLFYPLDKQQLKHEVHDLLVNAIDANCKPKALIVPHAGYQYSGPVAASAYACLDSIRAVIQRVVLLGPAHRLAVQGLALPGVEVFDTPLGSVELDQNLVNKIAHLPQIVISREAHDLEHSLEVQLPFLQSILGKFTLLPLAVGFTSAEAVADVLAHVWGGEETLIIVSSDLSHYLPYSIAQRMDQETMQSIVQLQKLVEHDRACGSIAINGLIVAAQQHHLTPHVLDLRNSGDTAGSHERVVGYAAIAFD